ncbi:NADH-quinone oxidoreductase subunit A [Nocardioides panacisoli]|uniref:NADH-quinone oxidoreductase subunit A n=1 Tax=Nocardioides panacisoli TaxID=627624 RepID=UPI001C62618B|nr:NADH-quinone oxidoreductase subunit A [Nocardioides panacisoli]QYJ05433.1 NADH-quinone oxidoreductase subunit A [Nocardioides panacisoli]
MVLVALVAMSALGVLTLWVLHRAVAPAPTALTVLPQASGRVPAQHALSRYHARWYAASVVFLAFDVEMLFMYPWAVVVTDLGVGAVVEMFAFLAVLLAAVAWARREGAFRWA